MTEQRVGLDSQCLSYLIDAASGVTEPTDLLVDERKALLRAWFYGPGRFFVSETVLSECARIRGTERRQLHESFGAIIYWGLPIRDAGAVAKREAEFGRLHPKASDCRILAEAEDLVLDTLLTYDEQLMKRLSSASPTVALATPSSFWLSLGIPRGAKPHSIPHATNPLSGQSWWRW